MRERRLTSKLVFWNDYFYAFFVRDDAYLSVSDSERFRLVRPDGPPGYEFATVTE